MLEEGVADSQTCAQEQLFLCGFFVEMTIQRIGKYSKKAIQKLHKIFKNYLYSMTKIFRNFTKT